MPDSTAPHFRRMSRAEFCAMYLDTSISVADIAQAVGLSKRAVSKRARSYGIEVRSKASKRPHIVDTTLFSEVWTAGIDAGEMAAHFGVSYRTVANTADRLGLPKRRKGQRAKISLAEFLLLRSLTRAARDEEAALARADMRDGDPRRWAA